MRLPRLVPHPSHPPLCCSPQVTWRHVLVLGLDGAGKSSILHYICSQRARKNIAPTYAFNSAQLCVEGLEMDLLEGKSGLPPLCPQSEPAQPRESPTCWQQAEDAEHPKWWEQPGRPQIWFPGVLWVVADPLTLTQVLNPDHLPQWVAARTCEHTGTTT